MLTCALTVIRDTFLSFLVVAEEEEDEEEESPSRCAVFKLEILALLCTQEGV